MKRQRLYFALRGVINERGTQGVSIIGAIKSKQNLG